MRAHHRAQLLGAVLALAAVPALIWVAEPLGPVLAFGLGATGLFLLVVVAQRAVPADAAQAMLQRQAAQVAEVRAGLGLAGKPVYVPGRLAAPANARGGAARNGARPGGATVFFPASDDDRPVPLLDGETVLYAGSGSVRSGIAAPPVTVVAPLAGPLADVEGRLAGSLAAADLAQGLTVAAEHGGRLKADFRMAACDLPCLADPSRPACLETGCAVCQTIGCHLAVAMQRPVAAEEATVKGRRVTIWFRPEPSSGEPRGSGTATLGAATGDGGGA